MMDIYNLIKFLIGVIFLSIASFQDMKDREIMSIIWLIMGIISSIFLILFYFTNIFFVIILIIIFFSWFIELEKIEKYLDIIVFLISMLVLLYLNENPVFFVDIILMLAYKYLHYAGILGGKADARAIMAITLLNPLYPELFSSFYARRFIVQLIFPYSLEVLFYAAILNAIIFSIYLFIKNMKNNSPKELNKIFTHEYKNNEWVKYQTPFVFSILLGFVLSYIFDLFFFI